MRTFTTRIDKEGRVCTKCLEYKLWPEFPKHKNSSTGFGSSCKECSKAVTPPEVYRERHLMRLYGLTLADFACLLDEQDYLCAVCKEPGNLVVDHCHETGQVRGLLCHGCNVGLGYFVDSPTRLRQAAEYLENNE